MCLHDAEEILPGMEFNTIAKAQVVCDQLNEANPGAYYCPIEVVQGPFVLDENGQVVLNPRKEG